MQALSDNPTPSFKVLSQHLLQVANVPVRNVGTWAGNIMMVHEHNNFPSDVFTTLAGLGATVTIGEWLYLGVRAVTVQSLGVNDGGQL